MCTTDASLDAPPSGATLHQRLRRDALIAAITANEGRLHALAVRMLGDHHAAQDAVQDACLRAFQALDRYRGDASMGTWLYRITINVCLDQLRRRKRTAMEPLADNGDVRVVERDFSETLSVRSELAGALAALPSGHSAAIVLTDALGFNYADAGTFLGIPAGTVGSRVHRARTAVRTMLEAAA
jgi:RNA polymerase sigma-70 factor (ECF subfamily)